MTKNDRLRATESDLTEVALTKTPLKYKIFGVVGGIVLWGFLSWIFFIGLNAAWRLVLWAACV